MNHSADLIRKCAELSNQVYSQSKEVDDLGYLITDYQDLKIVAIRGTSNLRNAARDINVVPWKGPRGFLSTWGFVRAYEKLAKFVFADLEGYNGRVVFTGHSLGGSVATLMAEKVIGEVITFGSPRVYFRFNFYKSPIKHTRIYMSDDPVPMIPRLMFKHLHYGFELLDGDSSEELLDVKDHSMKNYLKYLYQIG